MGSQRDESTWLRSDVSRRRYGQILIGLGLATIVAAVLWMLEVANGPGTGPKTFAERRSYDQVKASIHETFPIGFPIGLAGLGLTMLGARLARRGGDS